jgi:hypothetical protein
MLPVYENKDFALYQGDSFQLLKDPAGTNNSTPTNITPETYLIMAFKNNFLFISFSPNILIFLSFCFYKSLQVSNTIFFNVFLLSISSTRYIGLALS